MAKIVSSSEAQNNFGAVAQWAEENPEGVIVQRRGKPALALIAYEEYEEFQQLKDEQRRRKALAALEALRRDVQAQTPNLTEEEAYRAAGFSEEVIRETIAYDQEWRRRAE